MIAGLTVEEKISKDFVSNFLIQFFNRALVIFCFRIVVSDIVCEGGEIRAGNMRSGLAFDYRICRMGIVAEIAKSSCIKFGVQTGCEEKVL